MSTRVAIARALRVLAPKLPSHEFEAVLDHAVDSPGLRVAAAETAAWLALVAYALAPITRSTVTRGRRRANYLQPEEATQG